jgi:predicted enzyme related to lactoylglutathione lyase
MPHPVVHWELWSKDPARLADFYARVFGWQIQHHPEMNYRIVESGGEGGIGGGIMQPREGPWPGNMTFYIAVDDLAACCATLEQAGAKLIVERAEVPGMGAFALFEDPDGRVLGIWQSNG